MKSILSLIVVGVLVCCVMAEDQTQPEPEPHYFNISLDTPYKDTLVANNTRHYKLDVPTINPYKGGDWYLFMVLQPSEESDWYQSEIKITKHDAKGNPTHEVDCLQRGIDSCIFPGNLIDSNESIFVSVTCAQDCTFDLYSYFSASYPLKIGKTYFVNFEDTAYAKMFTLDLSKLNFTELRVTLLAETTLVSNAPVKLFANIGKDTPTPQKHQIQGVHLWDDGLGFFLTQQDLAKDAFVTILISGPEHNILKLSANIIHQYINQIPLVTPFFDYLPANSSRDYYVDIKDKLLPNQTLLVKVSKFTGQSNTRFFSDVDLKKLIVSTGGFGSLGDTVFRFSPEVMRSQNITQTLFFKVETGNHIATYSITVTKNYNNVTILGSELAELGEVFPNQVDSYVVPLVSETKAIEQMTTVKINVHNYAGETELFFSQCTASPIQRCGIDKATFNANQTAFSTIKPFRVSKFSSLSTYEFNVTSNQWEDTDNISYKRVDIRILVKSALTTPSKYSIAYENKNKLTTLRENHPLKDRVSFGQQKYYRVILPAYDALAINVHVVEVSGRVSAVGYRQDPRSKEASLATIFPVVNTLSFKEDLHTKPIYIAVSGEESALYSLTVSVERAVALHPDPQVADQFNYIVVPENILQEFKVDPYTSIVVKLTPNQQSYEISVTSSVGKIEVCGAYEAKKVPVHPACSFEIQNGTHIVHEKKDVYLGIHNPNNLSTFVKVKYSDTTLCEVVKMGDVFQKKVSQSENATCYRVLIQKFEDIEIVYTLSNLKYKQLKVHAIINSESHLINGYTYIHADSVKQACKYNTSTCELILVFRDLSDTEVQSMVQYLDGPITLLDGISQKIRGSFSPTTYKNFRFKMSNKIETTIFLESRKGFYNFYVRVIDDFDHFLNWAEYPSPDSYEFMSKNQFYSSYNSLTITEKELKNNTCTHCILLITVCSTGTEFIADGKFSIEATQGIRILKDHTQTIGYLEKGSVAFYQYQFLQEGGDHSLIVSLSTQNKNCAAMYLASGTERAASGGNYIAKSTGNQMVYLASKGTYSITVDAIKDCKYTISALASSVKILELNAGVFRDFSLEKDQAAYFFYQHQYNADFKIMSLESFGEVMISANVTRYEDLEDFASNKPISSKPFTWNNQKDFLRVTKTDKEYCFDCFYLIQVRALKKTESALIVHNNQAEIPISIKKDITDRLEANDSTVYRIYQPGKLNVSVQVIYGEVSVMAEGKGNNETKTFKAGGADGVWEFQPSKNESQSHGFNPIKFRVKTNDKASMYKFSVDTTAHTPGAKEPRKIKKGIPTYVFLGEKLTECVEGILQDKQQRLMISTTKNDEPELSKLKITAKIGSKVIDSFIREQVHNSMMLGFSLTTYSINNTTPYTFCFESQKYMSLTLVPTASVALIPEGASFMVNRNGNYTLAPQGKLIVEILECEGTSTVLLSKQFDKLSGAESEILHWRRFGQNYVVEAEYYGPVFLSVSGPKSIVRWMHEDEDKGQGIGYSLFRIPSLKYQLLDNNVIVKVPPLTRTDERETRVNIKQIRYTAKISNSETILKSNSQCGYGNVVQSSVIRYNGAEDMFSPISLPFNFNLINDTYGNSAYLWVTVTADLILQPAGTSIEQHYKFVYDMEEIAWGDSVRFEFTPIVNQINWWFIISIAGILLLLLVGYFIGKCIIMKLRQKYVGQEVSDGNDLEANQDV